VVNTPPRPPAPPTPPAPPDSLPVPKPPTNLCGSRNRCPAYHKVLPSASEKQLRGLSLVTLTLLLTTPAVLAAALLRPRSGSRRGR
ncbi:hypothetical protein ACSNOG_21975, partial [Streptomyces sp. URMC 124]